MGVATPPTGGAKPLVDVAKPVTSANTAGSNIEAVYAEVESIRRRIRAEEGLLPPQVPGSVGGPVPGSARNTTAPKHRNAAVKTTAITTTGSTVVVPPHNTSMIPRPVHAVSSTTTTAPKAPPSTTTGVTSTAPPPTKPAPLPPTQPAASDSRNKPSTTTTNHPEEPISSTLLASPRFHVCLPFTPCTMYRAHCILYSV